jgi:hypothetical protein
VHAAYDPCGSYLYEGNRKPTVENWCETKVKSTRVNRSCTQTERAWDTHKMNYAIVQIQNVTVTNIVTIREIL